MTQAFNLGQLANYVNTSGQLNASTGLYNTTSLGFPTGTRMSFNQTAAPTGWTKDTTAAINDAILRLVTGTVSSGGSVAFSTWNASGTTGATTLTTAQLPTLTRQGYGVLTFNSGLNNSTTPVNGVGWGAKPGVGSATTVGWATLPSASATGGFRDTNSGGSHSHSLSNNVKYYDFIIASKD